MLGKYSGQLASCKTSHNKQAQRLERNPGGFLLWAKMISRLCITSFNLALILLSIFVLVTLHSYFSESLLPFSTNFHPSLIFDRLALMVLNACPHPHFFSLSFCIYSAPLFLHPPHCFSLSFSILYSAPLFLHLPHLILLSPLSSFSQFISLPSTHIYLFFNPPKLTFLYHSRDRSVSYLLLSVGVCVWGGGGGPYVIQC